MSTVSGGLIAPLEGLFHCRHEAGAAFMATEASFATDRSAIKRLEEKGDLDRHYDSMHTLDMVLS